MAHKYGITMSGEFIDTTGKLDPKYLEISELEYTLAHLIYKHGTDEIAKAIEHLLTLIPITQEQK